MANIQTTSNSKFNKVLSFLPAFFLLLLLIMLLLAVLFRARARARLRARWRTDSNLELLPDDYFIWHTQRGMVYQ
jgi:hypothetical protein